METTMDKPLQHFICTVESAPEGGFFTCVLRDETDPNNPAEMAEIRVETVPSEDRALIVPGAIFDLTIEADRRWRIKFRRETSEPQDPAAPRAQDRAWLVANLGPDALAAFDAVISAMGEAERQHRQSIEDAYRLRVENVELRSRIAALEAEGATNPKTRAEKEPDAARKNAGLHEREEETP
jgi:hypothetical protein